MSVRIAIIVEGATEKAFRQPLIEFLRARLVDRMPKLRFIPEGGRIPKVDRLKQDVARLLKTHDAVIALTDVYTGGRPSDFATASDAKAKMRLWVGDEPRFYPHAAQFDFEAWLLPYWPRIISLAQSNRRVPSTNPETIDHQTPPSVLLNEVFRTGTEKRPYSKIRDGAHILRGQDLAVAAAQCPELKAFLNTILSLSGAPIL